MFKLEFDPANKALALAMGSALVNYANGVVETAGTTAEAPIEERSVAEVQEAETAATNTALDVNEAAVADLGNDSPAQSTAEQGVGAAQDAPATAANARVDNHGVPFDADYCAKASDPYYKTGKNAGQWKKKKGVDQDEYDDWYASVRPKGIVGEERIDAANPEIDTTAAFSGQQQQQTTANTGAPADAGTFMVWVSEMTTAGHFTQADVTAAYGVVGIGAADIFQGENAVQNIASLHGVLSAKVPA